MCFTQKTGFTYFIVKPVFFEIQAKINRKFRKYQDTNGSFWLEFRKITFSFVLIFFKKWQNPK